jgi:hypothetical protein
VGIAAALLSKNGNNNGGQNVAQNSSTSQSATNNNIAQSVPSAQPENAVPQIEPSGVNENATANNTSAVTHKNTTVNKVQNLPASSGETALASKQNSVAKVNQVKKEAQPNDVQAPIVVEEKNSVAQNNPAIKNSTVQNNATVIAPKSDASNTTSVVMQQQNKDQKQVQMPLMPPTQIRSRGEQTARKYLLAMTTGTGVGRKNQSVAQLGFVAEKAIARKLYIESGINVAHNNLGTIAALTPSQLDNGGASVSESAFINAADQPKNLADVALVGTTNLSSRTGTFSSDDEVALAIAKVTPRYNIEVVPTIGYNINKRFRVAAGADISRAVFAQDTKDEVQYLQRNASQEISVRNWDAGLNGKVEVNVTRRIALGYRYRAGLTQVTPGNTVNTRRNFSNISLRVRLK